MFLPNVKHIHCIFHIWQNLDCHVQQSLGEHYNAFLSKFYFVHNSLNKTLFKIRWDQLNELFSCTNNYLIGTLDKIKESWGKAFICMVSFSLDYKKSNMIFVSFWLFTYLNFFQLVFYSRNDINTC